MSDNPAQDAPTTLDAHRSEQKQGTGRAASLILIIVGLLLAGSYVYMNVEHSLQHGRLAGTPDFDDVVYLHMGMEINRIFETSGILQVVKHFISNDLHSPYSSYLAALGYYIYPESDVSPYVMNFIPLLLYLLGWWYFARDLSPGFIIVLFITALAIPFASMMVIEFRPDLAWAAAIGFAFVLALTSDRFWSHCCISAVSGGILGAAIWIKPSVFAMTFLITGAALGGQLLSWWYTVKSNRPPFLPAAAKFCGSFLAIAGPYLLLRGSDMWHYFYSNSFGFNRGIWTHPGYFADHMAYYWSSLGAEANLWHWKYPILAVCVCWSLWSLRPDEPREQRARILWIWATLAGVFLLNAWAPMKTIFLGGAFYGPLIFLFAWSIAGLLRKLLSLESQCPVTRRIAYGTAALCLALSPVGYHWPGQYLVNKVNLISSTKVNETVAQALLSEITKSGNRTWENDEKIEITFAQANPVVPDYIGMLLLRSGRQHILHQGAFVRDIWKLMNMSKTSDFVIAQETDVFGIPSYPIPAEPLQDRFLQYLKNSPRWREVTRVATRNGRYVYLFANVHLTIMTQP